MPPMTGVRKPVMVEAVKRMSKVMMEVSKGVLSRGLRAFSAATLPASFSFVRR